MDMEALAQSLEDFKKFAETMTGMRQSLIEMGWSDEQAGELVITVLRSGQSA